MRPADQARPSGLLRPLRAATALLAMAQLVLVAAAPLAERPDSTVAPVHVEQAGTSTHHAHGELCAVCVASHLVAPPARAAVPPVFGRVATQPAADGRLPAGAADRVDTQPRAPPA
ncbi:MAG TPA: hypothetical protein VFH14_09520 [Gemmatimonadaceae bacterium]|nr:hypothetical protein [Gemmatimonadaceae bacterium]